mmetsp:Transcript_5660/g.8600  ORF Transcript_5660/g.8600 Transcript_5660/m.8600 type:complete len:145 (-) Transcript_5660:120-554(-)|eukprot:CAMPEP_0185023932 /NCGR_PEP_ID=MMETSP1103-20130426/6644_1 /TAXON_ID=36769 /ORGANISM="Paraphysomonas bandaiensis, Strain Caron Lab Isolate" /LENGTH=144 /DNA_ID=CAMNT_0027556733 /DNA_START=60 /DNA_END=494 /DNA_ORIENTATION=+
MSDDGDYEDNHDRRSRNKGRRKGRGHAHMDDEDRYKGRGGVFETIEQESTDGPAQSIEGWIVFVSNVHEEAQEDDILDKFSEYGDVKNIHVNLDRRTGFVKGYALVEFESRDDAAEAIDKMNGQELLGQTVTVDWAFVARPNKR